MKLRRDLRNSENLIVSHCGRSRDGAVGHFLARPENTRTPGVRQTRPLRGALAARGNGGGSRLKEPR